MNKQNSMSDLSTDNLYELLSRAEKSPTQYVAQIQAIKKELLERQSTQRD